MLERIIFLIIFLITGIVGSCSEQTEPVPQGTPVDQVSSVLDVKSFVAALENEGAVVEQTEVIEQPFFAVPAQTFTVDGNGIQVFEFDTEALAAEAASNVSEDGMSVGTSMIGWMAPPHFYLQGRIIVIFIGVDEPTQSLLENILGPQFAGSSS